MRLFDRFRSPDPPSAELIVALVDRRRAAEQWEELAADLDAHDVDRLGLEATVAWHRARGLAAERSGRTGQAGEVYLAGLERAPHSSWLHLLAGQVLERQGRFEEALPHLAAVRVDDAGGPAAMTAVRDLYLWSAWQEARTVLDSVFDVYWRLGVADDHFLWTRGLPFFSEAFGARAAVEVVTGRPGAALEILERSERDLAELSTEMLRLTLQAATGERGPLLERLDARLVAPDRLEPPGYDAMRAAVWAAADDPDLESAVARLAAVELGAEVFAGSRMCARWHAPRPAAASATRPPPASSSSCSCASRSCSSPSTPSTSACSKSRSG